MSDDKSLLEYNERGALSHVLAIEEHLQQLPAGADRSWCARKHAILALDHHLAEAVNHASRIDPARGARYRVVRDEAVRVLSPAVAGRLPDLGSVARLRNAMRGAFEDRTLGGSQCSVCKSDHSGAQLGAVAAPREWWTRPLVVGAGGILLFALWKGWSSHGRRR